jgi:hypothetical protein
VQGILDLLTQAVSVRARSETTHDARDLLLSSNVHLRGLNRDKGRRLFVGHSGYVVEMGMSLKG